MPLGRTTTVVEWILETYCSGVGGKWMGAGESVLDLEEAFRGYKPARGSRAR
ncbi:MAG: hypothetical protein N3H31_04600 [Candidatus Nezhaarchaeota archaeon]|nr:hypothetical protein [Candidatus Nezhaarchaeota archaeon]